MIRPQPAPDDEAVNRWLRWCHRDIVSDLTGTLDLSAGIREIAIADDHRTLVSVLSDTLDLDSGLAAILPTHKDRADPDTPESPSERSLPSTSSNLVNALVASPVTVRLTLRASVLNLAQAVDIVRSLRLAKVWGKILITDLTRTDAQAIVRALAEAIAHAHARAGAIAHARAEALVWELDFNHDLVLAPNLTHDLAYVQCRAEALSRAYAHACELVHAIVTPIADDLGIPTMGVETLHAQQLRDVVDDLTGTDLHNVDLGDMQLDGVRWSDTTRWPTQWIDHIRQNSVDLGNQVYEYRPGSSTVDDGLLASR